MPTSAARGQHEGSTDMMLADTLADNLSVDEQHPMNRGARSGGWSEASILIAIIPASTVSFCSQYGALQVFSHGG